MTINYTTLLGLAKPVTGTESGAWGDVVNDQITSLVEDAIANAVSISVSAGNVTLSDNDGSTDQARMAILLITGSPGTSRNIVAPSRSKWYIVRNGSDSSVVVKGSATTGVTIAAGKSALVFWNGSDFATNDVIGTLPVSNGGTGATTLTGVLKGNGASPVTASNVNLASEVTGTLPIANGGTGSTTDSGARTNLGLGSMATQAAGNVAITGGSITGITDLAVADGGTGASSITANRVILGNGSSALNGNLVAPGTSGNVLTSNGTTWAATALPAPATGPNAQVFTSSGTFTVPAGVTKVIVNVWGGGGGGANASVGGTGGTGGPGGYGRAYVSGLTPGASIIVTVGGGGNAGAGGAGAGGGAVGGTSSFGTYLSCTGGNPANGASGGQTGVPTVSGATLLLKSSTTAGSSASIISIPNGGANNGTTSVICCSTNYGRGGGGGMSGGGAGADGSVAGRLGGSAFGAGADGANSTLNNGGNGGGSNGGTGSVYTSGYNGSGGGGTGGVVVYW